MNKSFISWGPGLGVVLSSDIRSQFYKVSLKKFGLHKTIIKWFNTLYSDIRSNVIVNGAFTVF